MKKLYFLPMIFISTLFFSCNSVPEIPQDATSTQLIQLGQDAIDIANYKGAEAYYMATIQRYGMDSNIYIEARYELGRLYLKEEKWSKAYLQFKELLDLYETSEPGQFPPAYKKLSVLSIEQIPEKYRK